MTQSTTRQDGDIGHGDASPAFSRQSDRQGTGPRNAKAHGSGGRCRRSSPAVSISRRLWLGTVLVCGGCSSLGLGRDDPQDAKLDKLLKVPDVPDLVRQAAAPYGLTFASVEGVGAINGLPGTGGSVPPSSLRDTLVEEMKRKGVPEIDEFLEGGESALVRVQAIIPPGARRGDLVDLRIVSPTPTGATSLHGGWLLETRLRQQQTLGGAVRKSDVYVVGTGPLVTRASSEGGDDEHLKVNAIVLGGGTVQQDRTVGLVIRPEYQHVKIAAQLADSINSRFYFYEGKNRGGIAKAREDDFIEISIHPRYRRNIHRLLAVVGMISAKGDSAETQQQLVDLANRLTEPTTCADAALQLEALGQRAIPTLLEAIQHKDPEIRFHAAEALAYLDRNEAIEPLEQLIIEHPAFRHGGLIALEGMDNRTALDALQRLMNQSSTETRYGALRSIRRRPDGQAVLRPTKHGQQIDFYRVASDASPLVAVSLNERAEIALFGDDCPVQIDDFLIGPPGLMVRRDDDQPDQLRVSRFRPGVEDRRATVPATLSGLLSGIAATGGDYGDCIEVLRVAKKDQLIDCSLAIDPLPTAMRTYFREGEAQSSHAAALPPSNINPEVSSTNDGSWWQWWK